MCKCVLYYRHRVSTQMQLTNISIQFQFFTTTCVTIDEKDPKTLGRFGDQIPVGARFFPPVQTGPEVHPTISTVGGRSLCRT